MSCFSSIGFARKDSSVPVSCPVSTLEFINILHNNEKKRESLVKGFQTNLYSYSILW